MKCSISQDDCWGRVAALIADRMGLAHRTQRVTDLKQSLLCAASKLGFENEQDCAEWLLLGGLSDQQIEVLAPYLTVGETYFYRDKASFDAISTDILPELIIRRSEVARKLRLWSAGCCTGEEPYTLAILLRQSIPNFNEWDIQILGTDLNPEFLRVAQKGCYGKWSFRDVPAGVKSRCFERVGDEKWVIQSEFRELVRFKQLNLANERDLDRFVRQEKFDIVFCRNVLMYLTEDCMERVIGKVHESLTQDGWLSVSPSEASQQKFRQFRTVNFSGATLYRKAASAHGISEPQFCLAPGAYTESREGGAHEQPSSSSSGRVSRPVGEDRMSGWAELKPDSTGATGVQAQFGSHHNPGRYDEADGSAESRKLLDREALVLQTRALANEGRLSEALKWCKKWVSLHKMDSHAHYLQAVLLLELGQPQQAITAFQKAIYLDSSFVMAHLSLGNIARSAGSMEKARKHYRNALRILIEKPPDEPLAEAEGLTARGLIETIHVLLNLKKA